MQKLSKREKIMLYVLLFVVIITIAIFFLILPAQTKLMDLQASRDTLESELNTVKNTSIQYGGDLQAELTKSSDALAVEKLKFYEDIKAEDVDALLTSMVKTYGLKPLSLDIQEVSDETLLNFEDFMAVRAETKTLDDVQVDEMRVFNVSMSVDGTIVNVQRLVNDANVLKSLRVDSVNYTTTDGKDDKITIAFKVYVI